MIHILLFICLTVSGQVISLTIWTFKTAQENWLVLFLSFTEVRATILPYNPICLGYLRQLNPTLFVAIKATGEAENTEENSAENWEFSLFNYF